MQIRLDQLEEKHLTWKESLRVDPDELSDADVAELGDVDCRGSVDETAEGWVVRLKLSYPQTLRCVRCLEPVSVPMELETALVLVLSGDDEPEEESEEEWELDPDDLGVQVIDEPEIDTRELVLEPMQLAVPMKPLCREDCKGLCGTCGQNLNEGDCECQPAKDPRWSALEKLKNVH